MKTIKVKLYEYEDLIKPKNKAILDKVVQKWDSSTDVELNAQELRECIDKFCSQFRLKIHHSYDDFRNDDDGTEGLEGNKLRTYLVNNRPFFVPKLYWTKRTAKKRASKITKVFNTVDGLYFGEMLVEAYWNELQKPNVSMDWIVRVLDRLATKAFDDEREFTSSQEYILEAIAGNEYNFNEHGEMING